VIEPDYMPGWPLAGYELALVPDGFSARLVVRRQLLDPAKPDLAALANANPRAILAFPVSTRFTYFGARRPREEPAWHASWTGAQQLPRAVRIGPEGGEPGWPDFVIPLVIDTPAACLGADDTGAAQGDAETTQACPR
jgi:hypothetical protein